MKKIGLYPRWYTLLLFPLLALSACSERHEGTSDSEASVADDVLFLVLGKMALYDQLPSGDLKLRNHHFVAEIMPRDGRRIIGGTLASAANPDQILEFAAEGNAFLAHGARVMDAVELHKLHPDGEYVFSYETESGWMQAQPLNVIKRAEAGEMPGAAAVALRQDGNVADVAAVNADVDLSVSWESMPGNDRAPDSDLDDLIFVLVFDCFGNNVAHSGRPYQGGPYLTYKNTNYVVPSDSMSPGLRYTLIVEQATADVDIYRGVPGIATYATLTFVRFQTTGEAGGKSCPDQASGTSSD